MKKRIMALSLTVCMAMALVACGNSGSSTAQTTAQAEAATEAAEEAGDSAEAAGQHDQQYDYNVAASVTTGQSYRWVVPMCELVNKYSDFVTLNPVPTSGSTENVNLILSGECAFGVGPVSTVYNAVNGLADWEGNPASGIEFTYAYMGDYFNVYLPENSSVETLADLKGMSVAIGEVGTGSYTNGKSALEAMGYSLDDFKMEDLSMGNGASAMAEGWLDGLLIYGSATNATISEMQAGPTGLKMVSLTDQEIKDACANNPIFKEKDLVEPYPGIGTIHTFGGVTAMFNRDDVPEEVTYEIAKIINEHIDELSEAFERGEESAIENSVGVVSIIPTAAGTEKYMKELGLE